MNSGQRRKGRFKSKKQLGEKALQALEDLKTRLVCFSCVADFGSGGFDTTNICINPLQNATIAKDELLTICPPFSRFCKVDIVRINGAFKSILRGCGDSICNDSCFQKGYGIEIETCTFCCKGIDLDEFSDETSGKFVCPTRVQNLRQKFNWHEEHPGFGRFALFVIAMISTKLENLKKKSDFSRRLIQNSNICRPSS